MDETNIFNSDAIIERLRYQVFHRELRITLHAHQEMAEEDISYNALCEAMVNGIVIEKNYPGLERGSCCLVCGQAAEGGYLHIVCTTSLELAIIITVYEPMLPKWITPFQRRKKP